MADQMAHVHPSVRFTDEVHTCDNHGARFNRDWCLETSTGLEWKPTAEGHLNTMGATRAIKDMVTYAPNEWGYVEECDCSGECPGCDGTGWAEIEQAGGDPDIPPGRHASRPSAPPIDTGNWQFVGALGLEHVVVLYPDFRMTPARALLHAAYLVTVAETLEPDLDFADYLEAVRST